MDIEASHLVDVSATLPSVAARYDQLATRAEAFLRDQGGVATEDALIAHVFGSTGSVALWRTLMRTLLAGEERLTLRADGRWVISGADARSSGTVPLLSDFVALDVETTGLRPSQQRIIEVAAVRMRNGVDVERFETLVNPERRLPKYIADLTRISNTALAEAPLFASIADRLAEFLEGALIVGHNVDFDVGFVDAELRRLGRPSLVNDRLDTLGLIVRLVPQVRKPNLHAAAQRLGIPTHGRRAHRAGPDALLAGLVAHRLAEHARQAGFASVDELRGLSRTVEKQSKTRAPRARAVLDRSLLATIPRAPGVYLMRDKFERIVYVGKANNLRERVGSYFSQPLGYTRKMDGLLESLTRVDVEVVGSELEALLLEAQLIRRYQPRYNTALRSHESYPFIRVDVANAWPRITLSKQRRGDGARYFGPFRNAAAARKTVDLLNRVVPLRTCSRSFKDGRSYGSPCLELDLGRCLGPCVGKADREQYRGLVRNVLTFLDGRDEVLYEILWRSLEEAAAALDFERAERLRRELRHVQAVVASQRRLRLSGDAHSALVVLPSGGAGSRELLLIVRGRPWARFRADDEGDVEALARRVSAAWDRLLLHGSMPVDHDSVDDAFVVDRWLARHAGHPSIIHLPMPPASISWRDVAAAALRLPEDALLSNLRLIDPEPPSSDATDADVHSSAAPTDSLIAEIVGVVPDGAGD